MRRKTIAALLAVLTLTSLARAQAPGRFSWHKGQVLVYRANHLTKASYVMGETTSESRTNLSLTKRWQVLDMDAAGAATLQLSLASLVYEIRTPSGEALSFDSAHPEKSPEPVRKQFGSFVGEPLVVLRIDGQGKVLEVKEVRGGFASAAKFESDLPFKILLPAEGMKMGQGWERGYQITLEPPQGTGEKYPAVQRYICKSIADNLATVTMATDVKATPSAQEDQVPLWQMQPEGEIVFDVQAGRLQKVKLHIDKEVKGTQGEGSSTRFESTYTEEYIGDR
jgi:hypothetical protein